MSWDPTRPSNTRARRNMRARVLHEQPICAIDGCDRASTQDDHIVGWSDRVTHGMTIAQWDARENHQGLCAGHHDDKTKTEAATARATTPRVTQTRQPERHPGLL